jgi:anti-anti-sigma factor
MVPHKILIIDDEPLIVKSVSLLLKKAGMTGIGALSGEEGLRMAASERPDMILLDLKMPKMGGWEVLAQLRQDETLCKIPVVIFSAEAIADSDRIAKELNVVEILQKPLDSKKIKIIFNKMEGITATTATTASETVKNTTPLEESQRIVVEKNMTGAFVSDLEKRFLEAMKAVQGSLVVLDLTDVSVIDSRGVSLCIGLKKECDKKGSPFTIETNPEIHKMFKMCKLTRVIDMKEVDRS